MDEHSIYDTFKFIFPEINKKVHHWKKFGRESIYLETVDKNNLIFSLNSSGWNLKSEDFRYTTKGEN